MVFIQMAKIEIFGQDNYVLINNTYKNLILAQKGVVSFAAMPNPPNIGSRTQYSYNGGSTTPPLLAIYSTFPIVVQTMQRSGTSFTWQIICGADGINKSAEIFIFDLPQNVPNQQGILQLFNTVGELVFDSSLQYSKVERMFPYTLTGNSGFDVNPARKYAAVTSKAAGQFMASPYPPLTQPPLYGVLEQTSYSGFYMQSGRVNTQQFGWRMRTYATSQPVTGGYNSPDGVLLVLDVTGL